VWAGVDSAWEQGKLEARKMLENAAESHTSGARCVSPFFFSASTIVNQNKPPHKMTKTETQKLKSKESP